MGKLMNAELRKKDEHIAKLKEELEVARDVIDLERRAKRYLMELVRTAVMPEDDDDPVAALEQAYRIVRNEC